MHTNNDIGLAKDVESHWPMISYDMNDTKNTTLIEVTCEFCKDSLVKAFNMTDYPVPMIGVKPADVNKVINNVKHLDHCVVHLAREIIKTTTLAMNT